MDSVSNLYLTTLAVCHLEQIELKIGPNILYLVQPE